MTCSVCSQVFEKNHFNQKCCSESCRILARKTAKAKYKKTDKGRAANKRWQSSERFKQNEKKLRQKPRAKMLSVQRVKKFTATPRGKIIKLNADHRRRMAKKSGYVTAKEWCEKLKQYDYCCAACGVDSNIQIDHIIPLSKGGAHHIDNIQPLCGSCNASKGAKLSWGN